MSYIYKPIAFLAADGTVHWLVGWPPALNAGTPPPDETTAASAVTTFTPLFYHPAGTDADGLYNAFCNRVPLWVVDAGMGNPKLADLQITMGNTLGFAEPTTVAWEGNADWTVIDGPHITQAGGRDGYVKHEENLPSPDPTTPDLTASWSYQYSVTLQNTDPAYASAEVTLTFYFLIACDAIAEYQGQAYVACQHYVTWEYSDDGGSSFGGFLTDKASQMPVGGDYGANTWETRIRLGKRTFGTTDHMAFNFSAFEYNSVLATGGPSRTAALPVAGPPLEVDGADGTAHCWIQPDDTEAEPYFGYRKDNSDDSTALCDINTGHQLVSDAEFPWYM